MMTMDTTLLHQNLIRDLHEYEKQCMRFEFDPQRPSVKLHEPTYGAAEIWEALQCLLSTQVTMGEKTRRFEKEFARSISSQHGIMVNSGSSANLLAIAVLTNPETHDRLHPGDEVIVPALSWPTTVWPLIQCGLVPVIVDICPRTLNIDPNEIRKALSPRTRAIMPVHVYGNPCAMDEIMEIAHAHHLIVIEDCCEALGASYHGRSVGTWGRVGTFSFYYSHHITTLEGGMCVTNDFELAETLRILRAHGWVREVEKPEPYYQENPHIDPKFLFVNVGYNLRPTELQAAMGTVQLTKLAGFVDIRRDNAAFWQENLAPYSRYFDIQEETTGGHHSWFGFPITLKDEAPFKIHALREFLKLRHIETRSIIAGNIADQPAMELYLHRVSGHLDCAKRVMRGGFTFGNHHAINAQAREYVLKAVTDFLQSNT